MNTSRDNSRKFIGGRFETTRALFACDLTLRPFVLVIFLSAAGVFAGTNLMAQEPAKGMSLAVAQAGADVTVNPRTRTSDAQPSLAITPKGDCWMGWRGYLDGKEQIFGCRMRANGAEAQQVISPSPGVHDHPHLIATDDNLLWAVWASKRNDRWGIVVRSLQDDYWSPAQTLSDEQSNTFHPVAIETPQKQLVVAWQDYRERRFRILVRSFDGSQWRRSRIISDQQADSFRPVLAVDGQGRTWCFWDSYVAGNYAVFGRRISPSLGQIERITPEGQNCLKPVALSNRQHGLCVAWLRLTDIWGGEGAIDQLHTLHMAIRRNDMWQIVTTPDGNETAASLTHGLLARMHPDPGGIHGYTGRRRHPMLLEDGDHVWLLWERKTHHDGLMTALATGQLIGRRLVGNHWDEPVVLHSGYVDYHVPNPPMAAGGKTLIVASQLPLHIRRIYHRIYLDLNQTAPFHQDKWLGWKPVKLPHPNSKIPRQKVEIHGETLNVYWADLHCHTGLTVDAEGEIDELIHYARDRAGLDVVVMQENDFLDDTPLTESEYAIGTFHSNAFSRDGTFLALPGFEWTPRVPFDSPIVPTQQPPWRRSHPNHRTVIYPPPGGPLIRHSENGNNVLLLADAVEKVGGIMFTQHERFLLSGRKSEVCLEVASGWRTFIFKPDFIHESLNKGPHLGFVATSDSHRRNPGLGGGLTAICAKSLQPHAIIEALRNRRCWATNGSRIFLDARVNNQFMGEVVRSGSDVKVSLHVRGTRPLISATLVRDGKDLKTFQANGKRELAIDLVDQLRAGRHWYYWRVQQQGSSPQYPSNVKVAFGNYAWSSPHFVYVER
jgi:hypothetical protein